MGATTCSYADWLKSDLIVFIGSNVANNQPVTTKYLHHAKREGARVAVVNPYREPGMERYWIPSVPTSAVFGTRIADRLLRARHRRRPGVPHRHAAPPGGAGLGRPRVRGRAHGRLRREPRRRLTERSWDELEAAAGPSREEMLDFARMLGEARRGRPGVVDGGDPARPRRGQRARDREPGLGARVGGSRGLRADADPRSLRRPGRRGDGLLLHGAARRAARERRERRGALGAVGVRRAGGGGADRARDDRRRPRGRAGRAGVRRRELPRGAARPRVRARGRWAASALRVHADIVLSSQMLVEPADAVLVLPATTRYEVPGGITETSTERRVILSPEVPGPRVEEARPEWEVLLELARARAAGARARPWSCEGTPALREEIARVVPLYAGIEEPARGRRQLPVRRADASRGRPTSPPPTAGRASRPWCPPHRCPPDGLLAVSTRRGKQFNSMVQERRDSITGAVREAVLVSARGRRAPGHRRRRRGRGALRPRRAARSGAGRPRWRPATCRSTGRRATCCCRAAHARPRPAYPTTTRAPGWSPQLPSDMHREPLVDGHGRPSRTCACRSPTAATSAASTACPPRGCRGSSARRCCASRRSSDWSRLLARWAWRTCG